MQIRVDTLSYTEVLQGFSEDALMFGIYGGEVQDTSEHFLVDGTVLYLTLVLSLGDTSRYGSAGSCRLHDPNVLNLGGNITGVQKRCHQAVKTSRNETARTEQRPDAWRMRRTRLLQISLCDHGDEHVFPRTTCSKYHHRLRTFSTGETVPCE